MESKRISKIKELFYGFITVYWCTVIYGFSAEPAVASGGKSMRVAEKISEIIAAVTQNAEEFKTEEAVFQISHLIRKGAHIAAFFILAMVLTMFVVSFCKRVRLWTPFIFTILYAATDELHQAFVPGRGPRIYDVAIDSFGALLGMLLVCFLISRINKKYNLCIGAFDHDL